MKKSLLLLLLIAAGVGHVDAIHAADNYPIKFAKLPDGATVAGNILTVVTTSDTQSVCVSLPLKEFEGRRLKKPVVLSIDCWADELGAPTFKYGGMKFMAHYTAPDGLEDWPGCPIGSAPFPRCRVAFTLGAKNQIHNSLTLILGLQSTRGRVAFDLSTFKIQPADEFYGARTPKDFKCTYTERVTGVPRLKGFMLPPPRRITERDFIDMEKLGVTLVRYQMCGDGELGSTWTDLAKYNEWMTDNLRILDKVLAWARKYRIKVVVDMHVPPGARAGGGMNFRMFDDEKYHAAFIENWRRIARRFRGRAEIYGFDLANEPWESEVARHRNYWLVQKDAAAAIRAIDPDTPIIVECDVMDSPPGFAYLAPLPFTNVIYQVHMYEPIDFTHQNAVPFKRDFRSQYHYPDASRPLACAEGLRKILAPVREFEDRYGARIYVGVFSASMWATGAENYLRDCLALFDERGWDWTYHAFREWEGWSLEHEWDYGKKDFVPSADNPRRRVIEAALAVGRDDSARVDVAAIIWPAYQNDPRWKELRIFGDGKGEWQNVYEARPKRAGHDQPIVPYWGYGMDDDPKEVARQIDAASAAGINVFIYDWYWYEGRPFLESAVRRGFLGAPNRERMKFYLMFANHHVDGIWDNKVADKAADGYRWKLTVTPQEFRERLVPRWIDFFKEPNYYRIDGEPVFWIYWQPALEEALGGPEAVREAFAYFDAAVRKAEFPGLHLQCHAPFPDTWDARSVDEFCRYFGYKSATYYHTLNAAGKWEPQGKDMPYEEFVGGALATYDKWVKRGFETTLYPNLTTGWDNNARFLAGTYTYRVTGSTPAKFERYLRQLREWTLEHVKGRKLIILNAWNEWTEGCYLQPDEKFGYGYLNAVWRVFGAEK